MKTDGTNKSAKEAMEKRRQLQPLQAAAGDKENLVGPGRTPATGKEEPKTLKKPPMPPAVKAGLVEKKKPKQPSKAEAVKKKVATAEAKKIVITVEDLTSQAGPSEHYWEVLAERRRLALDKALEENKRLGERIILLEEENEQCKTVLEESRALIDTLSEILSGENGNASESQDSSADEDDVPPRIGAA